MRVAVVGSGAMGSAAAVLLSRHAEVDVVAVDADPARARSVVAAAGRGEARTVDPAGGAGSLAEAVAGCDAMAACLPYRLNLVAMEAALLAGVPYADLGGLFHMTLRQLELDGRFREAGLPAVAGIGCCPGISNLFGALAARRMEVRSIDILDGAVDQGLAGFGIPYSAETILDEYAIPAYVYEDGELREVPAGSGEVRYTFPPPLGEMVAIHTLHSELATMPSTIPGVRDVRWRLALPPPVHEGFRLLVDAGLASTEPVDTPSGPAVPRDVLVAVLSRLPLPSGEPRDHEVLDVLADGTRGGEPVRLLARATLEPQPEGIGAGAFGTAVPIATMARWMAEGRVPPGVHPPETAVDPEAFLEDLRREGVGITVEELPAEGPGPLRAS